MTDKTAIHWRLAGAYRELAEIHDELAGAAALEQDELAGTAVLPRTIATEPAQGLQPLPAQRPQVHVPPAPGPSPVLSVNMATHCPKHGTEYRHGQYGPYCPSPTDDPAFADRKGYCNLPGKDAQRALAWVRIQEGAAR